MFVKVYKVVLSSDTVYHGSSFCEALRIYNALVILNPDEEVHVFCQIK